MNRLTRMHISHTLSDDVFMLQKFGLAEKETLFKHMEPEDRMWMEIEMRRQHKNTKRAWYNCPMTILGQLVLKDEYKRMLSTAMARIDKSKLSLEEVQIRYDDDVKAVETSIKNRAYKLSYIANPANGAGFFQILYNLDWNAKGLVVTEDKLQMIASSTVGPAKKKEILATLAGDKQIRESLGMSSDNKGFRKYMAKETYWWHLTEAAKSILAPLAAGLEQLPEEDAYFRRQRQLHFKHAFGNLEKDMRNANPAEKQPGLPHAARRLVYRWLLSLKEERIIDKIPLEVFDWLSFESTSSMYPIDWKEIGLTKWELTRCPWWLDYPRGVTPASEWDLRASFQQTLPDSSMPQDAPMQGSTLRKKPAASDNPSRSRLRRRLHMQEQVMDTETLLPHAYGQEAPSSIADLPCGPGSVCAIVDDVVTMVERKTKSLRRTRRFLKTHCVSGMCIRGNPGEAMAKLVFADFPTSLRVALIQDNSTPMWNVFSDSLPMAAATIADLYVADQGWFVTLSIVEHLFLVHTAATKRGFTVHQCLTVLVEKGYIGLAPFKKISSLVLTLFYRSGYPRPKLHSKRAKKNYVDGIPKPGANFILDTPHTYNTINNNFCRGGAERSSEFCRYIIHLFTNEEDGIIDLFAGTGNLGVEAVRSNRHCVCLERDKEMYDHFLSKIEESCKRA